MIYAMETPNSYESDTDLLTVVLAKSQISENGSLWKYFLLLETSNLQKSCKYSKKGFFFPEP